MTTFGDVVEGVQEGGVARGEVVEVGVVAGGETSTLWTETVMAIHTWMSPTRDPPDSRSLLSDSN